MRSKVLDSVVQQEAIAYLQDGATVRSVAKDFKRSKTTVAYDLRNRLINIGRPDLHELVNRKMAINASEAPYLGGAATKAKTNTRYSNGNE